MRLPTKNGNNGSAPQLRLVVRALESRRPNGETLRLEIEPTELDVTSTMELGALNAVELEIGDDDIIDEAFDLDSDPSGVIIEMPPRFFRNAA